MGSSNVNLTPELEQFVESQVSSGHFNNASEVHRAALSRMAKQIEEREAILGHLRKEISVGLNDLETGHYTHFEDHAILSSYLDNVFEDLVKETS